MPLKISLKPHERMIIDGAVIRNGGSRSSLYIENNVPVLRQKDIMSEEDAASPACRIYFTVQLMYIDEPNLNIYHGRYWKLVKAFLKAAPSRLPLIDEMNEHIVNQDYYQALKLAKELIEYEKEAVRRVSESNAGVSIG
jgi:flagellar protein FlbT